MFLLVKLPSLSCVTLIAYGKVDIDWGVAPCILSDGDIEEQALSGAPKLYASTSWSNILKSTKTGSHSISKYCLPEWLSDLCALDTILNDAVTQLRLILVMSQYGINGFNVSPFIWRKGCLAYSLIFRDWSFWHAHVLTVAKKLTFSLTNQGVILLDEILSLLRGVSIQYLFRIHVHVTEIYVTTKTFVTTLIFTAILNFLVSFYHYPT